MVTPIFPEAHESLVKLLQLDVVNYFHSSLHLISNKSQLTPKCFDKEVLSAGYPPLALRSEVKPGQIYDSYIVYTAQHSGKD